MQQKLTRVVEHHRRRSRRRQRDRLHRRRRRQPQHRRACSWRSSRSTSAAQRRPGDRAAARPSSRTVPGATVFLQAVQDLRVGGRASNAQYQFTLQGDDLAELDAWAPRLLAERCARCRSSSTSTATSRTRACQATAGDRSRHRLAAGHHAAADRQHAVRRLRPAPGLDHVHAAEPVPRGDGGRAASTGNSPSAAATSTCVRRAAHRCR